MDNDPLFARFRPMRASDIDAAILLWERSPGVGLSDADRPEALARFLRQNGDHCFVAVAGEELVATALCGNDGRRGYIYHLAVEETFRGSGVGRQLVRRVLESLDDVGIDRCHAMVYADNEGGRAFWTRMGWRFRGDLVIHSSS